RGVRSWGALAPARARGGLSWVAGVPWLSAAGRRGVVRSAIAHSIARSVTPPARPATGAPGEPSVPPVPAQDRQVVVTRQAGADGPVGVVQEGLLDCGPAPAASGRFAPLPGAPRIVTQQGLPGF